MTTLSAASQQEKQGSGKFATPRDFLKSLVANACAGVNGQLDAFVGRLIEALLDFSEGSSDPKLASASFNIANLLKKNTYAFYYLASIRFSKLLQQEIDDLLDGRATTPLSTDGELSLVPFEEMERKLLLSNMARPYENAHAQALSALRKRLSVVLKQEELAQADNPFRPELFLAAMDEAWREFTPDHDLHTMALPLFKSEVFLDLSAVYEGLNKEFVDNNILSDLTAFYSIKKSNTAQDSSRTEKSDAVTIEQLRRLFGMPTGQTAAPQSQFPTQPQMAPIAGIPMIPGIPGSPSMLGVQGMAGAPMFSGNAVAQGAAAGTPYASGASGQVAMGANPFGGFSQTDAGNQAFPTLSSNFDAASLQQQILHANAVSNQLMGYLAALQKSGGDRVHGEGGVPSQIAAPSTSVLSQIKTQAPSGALNQVDERTIDLMTRIFDVVFSDKNIPGEMKALIGVLQVPVLKAALVDKEFFFQEDHPARRLIDLLSKSSVAWDAKKGKEDPLYQTIHRNVRRIQQEFEQETSVFSDVVTDLENYIEQEEAKSTEQLQKPIDQALRQEKVVVATKAAKHEVALRVRTGEVVAFVETFLQNKWVPVLTLAYSVKEERPDAYDNAVQTMDDLIWSVKPKITQEERKQLISKLPTMLAMLNKWLNLVKLDDAERMQFFAELAECHASIVRAPLEISPERRLEISMKVAQEAAERRKQKLEEEQAQAKVLAELDESVKAVELLPRGTWMEFLDRPEESSRVKLAWVSPMRSLYVFSTIDRKESFSLSAEALAEALRTERASILRVDGIVKRALAVAAEDLSANDPVLHLSDAA